MIDLADFLLARIAEDEDQARTFLAENHAALVRAGAPFRETAVSIIVQVLAECEAKRRIIKELATTSKVAAEIPSGSGRLAAQYGLDAILRLLALPYADHPDYNEEWRP